MKITFKNGSEFYFSHFYLAPSAWHGVSAYDASDEINAEFREVLDSL